jgi:5-methylcytosine-specific restriction endonuclease McrA
MTIVTKRPRLRLDLEAYDQLRRRILQRDGWRCQSCGSMENLEVHHLEFRSQCGHDEETNLITLCRTCHGNSHGYQYPGR